MSTWRLWVQGSEFYLGTRRFVSLGKISFHRNFNWQYRLGSSVTKLGPPLQLSNGWLLALQLAFLFDEDTPHLLNGEPEGPTLIETPLHHKCLISFVVRSADRSAKIRSQSTVDGAVIKTLHLRDGSTILAIADVRPREEQDEIIVQDMKEKLRVKMTSEPPADSFHVEVSDHRFGPRGNVIAVIGLGPEVVHW